MNDLHILISIDDQQLRLLRGAELIKSYPISSGARGVGFDEGSFRTPTGRFQVAEMIGGASAARTIFRGRQPVGSWDGSTVEHDLVLTRILWLDGVEEANRNTKNRFIYIHGTNHEDRLGTPASCGCIRLSNADVADLFERVTPGTQVTIKQPIMKTAKLAFFDCDSTLSTIEGIDELGRARGPEVFAEVEALTNAAMNGEIPIRDVFPKRMDIIQPDRVLCDQVAQQYLETITPGVEALIADLKRRGWTPIILSGGFAPLIQPLAKELGIEHVEAVPLNLNEDGSYAGFDAEYPTTKNGGKPDIIRDWKQATGAVRSIMVGDGISDLESRSETDLFVGFGGVVAREAVRDGADAWLMSFEQFAEVVYPMIGEAS